MNKAAIVSLVTLCIGLLGIVYFFLVSKQTSIPAPLENTVSEKDATQTHLDENDSIQMYLKDKNLSAEFVEEVSRALPSTIGDYRIYTIYDFYAKNMSSGDEIDESEFSKDIPALQVYGCDESIDISGPCQEQVWASYKNDTRMTQVIFTNFVRDREGALADVMDTLQETDTRNMYLVTKGKISSKFITWLPEQSFDTISTRHFPILDPMNPSASGDDTVTKYFFTTYSPK